MEKRQLQPQPPLAASEGARRPLFRSSIVIHQSQPHIILNDLCLICFDRDQLFSLHCPPIAIAIVPLQDRSGIRTAAGRLIQAPDPADHFLELEPRPQLAMDTAFQNSGHMHARR